MSRLCDGGQDLDGDKDGHIHVDTRDHQSPRKSALIAQQKLRIAKLEGQIYGQRSERSSRLIEQLGLTFEELEADVTEHELAAKQAVAKTTTVRGSIRKRAEHQTFPGPLPASRW